MKYIASCSCGKDSLAMVLTLIEKEYPLDHVVFVDLGKEFKSIYKIWDKLTLVLDDAGIKHKRLQLSKSFDYYFSEHHINTKDNPIKSLKNNLSNWINFFFKIIPEKCNLIIS